MNCTTSARTVRSKARHAGFTLIEMLFALVLMVCILGWYIRAFDEAEAIGDMLRINDDGRRMRISAAIKAIEATLPPERASDVGEAHPEDLNALSFEESANQPLRADGEPIAEQTPR